MITVWKYKLEEVVSIPSLLHVVMVGLDPGGIPCVWAEVDTDGEVKDHRFTVVGTGHDIPADGWHVGSYTDGPFIWHVYRSV